MNRTDFTRRALALSLSLALLCALWVPAAAEDGRVVALSTPDDWNALVKNCRLDVYSDGLTVLLKNDLDLTGCGSIPTFGGVFDGQGHSITGLHLSGAGSQQGLFRYLRKGAVVKNLTLTAVIAPGGDAKELGGIAGVSSGTILQCRVSGLVHGKDSVGGIVGVNEAEGQILNCALTDGMVSGEHFIGGIAGENYGSIVRCTNQASINTQEIEPVPQLEEFDWSKINSAENLPACTDVGGITGFSGGLLQTCTNKGPVGYPHIGYNIGGVAGRQTGYVSGCENHGLVQGRKDVGGVIGQAEPYTSLRYQEDTLQKLTDQLDTLSGVLSDTVASTDSTRHQLSSQLAQINGLTGQAQNDASDLLGDVQDFGGGVVDTVNDFSARVSRLLQQMEPVAGNLGQAADSLTGAAESLENLLAWAQVSTQEQAEALRVIRDSVADIKSALNAQKSALQEVTSAMHALWDALGDEQATRQALAQLQQATDSLADSASAIRGAVNRIGEALRGLSGWDDRSELADAVDELESAAAELEGAARELSSGVALLRQAATPAEKQAALETLGSAFSSLSSGGTHMLRALDGLRQALPQLSILWGPDSGMTEELDEGLKSIGDTFSSVTAAFDSLGRMLREQNRLPPLELPKLPPDFRDKEELLNDTLHSLGSTIQNANQAVEMTGDAMSGGIRQLNEQFDAIIRLLKNAQNEGDRQLVVDVSDEEIASATLGKVQSSCNTGSVDGDVNVGGVIGSMAVEFDFDPEDDVTDQGTQSVRFQYLTRAIAEGCENRGAIVSRKDCAGGVIGRMDLGVAIACENSGSVKSTGGSYVGGVAGASYAVIRDCSAKCALSGTEYVGGVAGFGCDIRACRTMVEIRDAECLFGAIAGDCDGTLLDNTFVSETLGGVDGISYQGKACPVPYADLAGAEGAPESFSRLTLTFTADGEVIKTIRAEYGKPIPENEIPPVPIRKGFSGEWSAFDRDCVLFDAEIEAVYTPWLTAISSENGDVLAEGTFRPGTDLLTEISSAVPDQARGEVRACYDVRLRGGDSPFIALRVRLPEGCRKAELWAKPEDGQWKKLDSVREKSYLRAELMGKQATVCLVETAGGNLLWIAGAGVLALAVILIPVLRHRAKKRRSKAKTEEKK